VPPEVWEFHVGGYQVCEKWLKDRKGRTLSYDDIQTYRKITEALRRTIQLMGAIDQAIPTWPLP
ncbi:MAG: helicase, partial [Planctomycetes bacterium]|nr:helicase [Planctomycetota bacterium]